MDSADDLHVLIAQAVPFHKAVQFQKGHHKEVAAQGAGLAELTNGWEVCDLANIRL